MEISQLESISETNAQEILSLSDQLGYANDPNLLSDRLKAILSLKDHAVFVGKAEGRIVGWLHCLTCLRVESPLFVEVTGLVVDENARGLQIGKKLIEASKTWTRNHGITILRIRCNLTRTESHKFYQALGFSSNKEQKVFEMSL